MPDAKAGMSRSAPGLGTPGRLPDADAAALSGVDPAWRPWLRLQELALAAAEDPAWDSAVPEVTTALVTTGSAGGPPQEQDVVERGRAPSSNTRSAHHPDAEVPLLHGMVVYLDARLARRARRLVRDLLR